MRRQKNINYRALFDLAPNSQSKTQEKCLRDSAERGCFDPGRERINPQKTCFVKAMTPMLNKIQGF